MILRQGHDDSHFASAEPTMIVRFSLMKIGFTRWVFFSTVDCLIEGFGYPIKEAKFTECLSYRFNWHSLRLVGKITAKKKKERRASRNWNFCAYEYTRHPSVKTFLITNNLEEIPSILTYISLITLWLFSWSLLVQKCLIIPLRETLWYLPLLQVYTESKRDFIWKGNWSLCIHKIYCQHSDKNCVSVELKLRKDDGN